MRALQISSFRVGANWRGREIGGRSKLRFYSTVLFHTISVSAFLVLMKHEPCIIFKLFLNIESVSLPESQRILFRPLFMSYLIVKQSNDGAELQVLYRC